MLCHWSLGAGRKHLTFWEGRGPQTNGYFSAKGPGDNPELGCARMDRDNPDHWSSKPPGLCPWLVWGSARGWSGAPGLPVMDPAPQEVSSHNRRWRSPGSDKQGRQKAWSGIRVQRGWGVGQAAGLRNFLSHTSVCRASTPGQRAKSAEGCVARNCGTSSHGPKSPGFFYTCRKLCGHCVCAEDWMVSPALPPPCVLRQGSLCSPGWPLPPRAGVRVWPPCLSSSCSGGSRF